MSPILIHTPHFPSGNYHAITLFPFVFYNGAALNEKELRHEKVHIYQQLYLLVIFFYLLYLAFWLINIVRYRNSYLAYRQIPFERSAYILEDREDARPVCQAFHWVECMKKG